MKKSQQDLEKKKQLVRRHGCRAAPGQSAKEIQGIACRHIEHDKIGLCQLLPDVFKYCNAGS